MELLASPLIDRLGWTLVHSLWQGAAIALVYGAAGWTSRERGPERRYALSLAALAALAAAPVATFLWLGADAAPSAARVASLGAAVAVEASTATDPATLLEPALPWIVALWCTGVLVSALRLWGAWRHLIALRRSALPLDGAELAALVARISAELGLARRVRIARSALVASPTVIGWLEPLVLVPTAALAGLSPQQLAMILAHELAHIRRHDYLVNALQSVVETLLFYHPAVRWISARARQEREECCDEVAVRFGGDALAYAHALADLEAMRGMRTALGLAATGGVLLERIERLLGRHPARQRGTALASACALAMLTALTASVGEPLLAPAFDAPATEVVAPRAADRDASLAPRAAAPIEVAVVPPSRATPVAVSARPATTTSTSLPADQPIAEPQAVAPAADQIAASATLPASAGDGEIAVVEQDAAPVVEPAPSGALPVLTGGERLVGASPSYPYGARARGLGGTVTARLSVDATGRTRKVEVIAADPAGVFDRAVIRALSNWRFAPLLEDGVPLEREIVQQFEFLPDPSGCHAVTGSRLCRKVGGDQERRRAGVTTIKLR
jgi:TonB family protein